MRPIHVDRWITLVIIGLSASLATGATLAKKLVASDALPGDYFGVAVAIAGRTVLVGEDFDDDFGTSSGSVHVFTLSDDGTTWTRTLKLHASDAAAFDLFSLPSVLSGKWAMAGSIQNDDGGTVSSFNSGSAYIFRQSDDGTTWSEKIKLSAFDPAKGDNFGGALAIQNGIAAAGAPGKADKGTASGAAYVYKQSTDGTTWSLQSKLFGSDTQNYDHFGCALALEGNLLAIGAYGADTPTTSSAGAVYIFRQTNDGTTWSQQAKLFAADGAQNDSFGAHIALSSGTLIVTASGDDDRGSSSGSAYIFKLSNDGTSWTQQAKLIASDAAADQYFGWDAAIQGDTVIVGAYPLSGSGGGYVFSRSNGVWSEQEKLLPGDGSTGYSFGLHVGLGNGRAIVSSPLNMLSGVRVPAAYVYDLLLAPAVACSPAVTSDTTPTWTWSSGGAGTGRFRYQLDAQNSDGWTTTTAMVFTPQAALSESSHTLYVQAEGSQAGLWSVCGSCSTTVDATAPNPPLVSSAQMMTTNPRPLWTWTSGGAGGEGRFRYQLDGQSAGLWSAITAELSYLPVSPLSYNAHTLYVQERDAAGNWSASGGYTLYVFKNSARAWDKFE